MNKWLGWVAWGGLVLGVGGGCRKSEPPAEQQQTAREELRDLSYTAIGRGYDRALDVVRDDCFDRKPPTVTPVNRWEAAGFTAFRDYEIHTKVKGALTVGVKIEGVNYTLGASTAAHIGTSHENSYFVMLARYVSHVETAGQPTGANGLCSGVTNNSSNGVEDFVSLCGDSYLNTKTYGGHVLVSWRRQQSDYTKDEAFGMKLGAKATNASIDAQGNLEILSNMGYGNEELFVETSGMPFLPTPETLADGGTGFTVKSVLEYLKQVSQTVATTPPPFARVVDYTLERQTIPHMNLCLAAAAMQAGVSEAEWACMYDTMTELVENREGVGDSERADLVAAYERHRLAVDEYLADGRLQFNTVDQSRCATDEDGDPDLETGGSCATNALKAFVDFYRACSDASDLMLQQCRSTHLGTAVKCDDFQTHCSMPSGLLPNGTPVQCTLDGLNAARAQVIDYTVLPPVGQPSPGAQFSPPIVMTFTRTPQHTIPGVAVDTHLCGITGVTGGLHESRVQLVPVGNDWTVEVHNATPDLDKAISFEVTCVHLDNFTYINGPKQLRLTELNVISPPALNGGRPYVHPLSTAGDPWLLGWDRYLTEARTDLTVTNPQPTGFAEYWGFDVFPLESTKVLVGTRIIEANPGQNGTIGGRIYYRGSGAPAMQTVGINYVDRSTARVSFALPDRHFCYLTSISGRWHNVSDSVRIDTSDGMTTLITSTPVSKDRNPGARVQCAAFDQL